MKPLKIWPPKPTDPDQPQRYLRMDDFDDEVAVVIVGESGLEVGAARFVAINRKTGAIRRIGGVNSDFGFDLDNYGRVKDVTPD